jgi:MATE family multidrug resistance protein
MIILQTKTRKVLIFGAPGYAVFEAGKRYLQAQGIFTATVSRPHKKDEKDIAP